MGIKNFNQFVKGNLITEGMKIRYSWHTRQVMKGEVDHMNKDDLIDYMEELHGDRDFGKSNISDRMGNNEDWILIEKFPIKKLDLEEYDIDPGLLDEYIYLHKTGNEEMPPIVINYEQGYWTIIDGLHRANVADAVELKNISAYIPNNFKDKI